MKKYNKIAYLSLILIILLSGFFIYKVSGKNGANDDINSKALSDVKQIERQFVDLFNQLNNITFENYKVSGTKIEENKTSNSSSSSSSSSSQTESETSGGSKNSSSESGGSSSSSQSSDESTEDSQNNKQYNIEETGVLINNTEINWKEIKNDVENIYTSLYPTTLDLYQTTTSQQDILNFNKEYDNLTKAIKDENKEDSLKELSILYDYLPKFVENCTDDEKQRTVIKTKNYIFKAYSVLDKEEWNTISDNINNATQEFTKLVKNINNQESGNQYNINKIYVMINELQNAVILKDKEVFLIKYKNLLEELQNI